MAVTTVDGRTIGLGQTGPHTNRLLEEFRKLVVEDGEKIYFLIKSKSDEYCFTNKGLLHLDGTSATSKKRTLRRFSYSKYQIKNVALETAGTIDLDVEIKFQMGAEHYSIDVHKKHVEELKDLYKALLKIEEIS
ncbi:PH domain-containing protein, partial [Escherichia coli]|nr:PH domain-containing protein [Escherichia coli]